MQKTNYSKADRKDLMTYMRLLCRQRGISSNGDVRITISVLADEDLTFEDALRWLENRMRMYPPQATLPPDRPRAPSPGPTAAEIEERRARKAARKARKKQRTKNRMAQRAALRKQRQKASSPPPAKRSGPPGTPQSRREAAMRKVGTQAFYKTIAWRQLRLDALAKLPRKCVLCGQSHEVHGVVMHVDHIKPIARFPHLALSFDNLQILCEDCNLGKGARYTADWRPSPDRASPAQQGSEHTQQAASGAARPASA